MSGQDGFESGQSNGSGLPTAVLGDTSRVAPEAAVKGDGSVDSTSEVTDVDGEVSERAAGPDAQDAPGGSAQVDVASASEDTILTLAEAARTVGLSERALRKHIEKGKLSALRIVRNGRAIAAATVSELKRVYGPLKMVPEGGKGPGATKLRSTVELSQAKAIEDLKGEAHALEARNAKLRALLGMERTQRKELMRQTRYVAQQLSRAEAQLEEGREKIQGLMLDLGRSQGRVEVLERQVAQLGGRVPKPIDG